MMKTSFALYEKSSVKVLDQDDGGSKQISWGNMKKAYNDPDVVLGRTVD